MSILTLTRDDVEKLRTPAGGFNQKSMEILGNWPLRAGWQGYLIGKRIGDRRWKQALKAATEGKKHFFRGNTRSHR